MDEGVWEETGGAGGTWSFIGARGTTAMLQQELCTADFHYEIITFDRF